MKVLFATYPMAFHTPGGGEIQLKAYQKHLPAHGVDVTLFDPWNPRFMEHDVFHFFSCVGGSIHLCNFVQQLGLPLVISSSLWITEETKHHYPIDEIRAQLDLADRVVANSDKECDELSRVLNLPREKFATVYNGVDDFFFKKVSSKLFRDKYQIQEKFVLNVGNIEPRKNQLTLVRAMKSFPDLKLVIIGHQRDVEYSSQVLHEGQDQVIYLGPLSQDDLFLSAYAACELFCLPSTLETPGLAALEARAQGVPIVVTGVGSTTEYFGNTVEYIDPMKTDTIVASIFSILNRPKVSGFPTEDAFKFYWTESVTELKKVYEDLI